MSRTLGDLPEMSRSGLKSAILDAVGDGVFGLTPEGITTFVNPAVSRMTGWGPDEMVGSCHHTMFHHTRPDGTLHLERECPIHKVCRTGLIHREGADVFWRKDGTSFPVSYTATPLLRAGAAMGAVIVFQSIGGDQVARNQELEGLVRSQNDELYRIDSQLQSILDSAALVAIIATDPSGTITVFNRGAERMLGYRAEEIVGKASPAIFHLKEETEFRAHELSQRFNRALQGFEALVICARQGVPEVREWTFVRQDGSYFPVSLGITAVFDHAGEITGFLGVAQDISKRKQAEETLRAAIVAAESANRAKSEFLATMSHEIRTPMNGIIGMADLLLNSDLDLRQRSRTRTLRDSASGLLNVLNDILDFSKIEASKLELEIADFDLRSLVEGVADLMAVKAQEKGLEFTCFIESDAPTPLSGDPNRLRQVLINLVGNAVKFTSRGAVGIRVRLATRGYQGSVHFEITDTGVGIPQDRQHLLFQRFSQADTSMARRFGGTGLGLSIVSGLVEMMGGELGFQSVEGSGSTFWFTSALPTQASVLRPPALSLKGKRVMVMENNDASRSVLRELLTFWQCDFEEFSLVQSALQRLREPLSPGFDVVILSAALAGDGGEQAGETIRREASLATLPIVLLTPLTQISVPGKWEECGCTSRVSKPVKQGELGAALALALNIRPLGATQQENISTTPRHERSDRSQHRILVVEDNPVNREVAMGMLEYLGYPADVVSDGANALTALRSKNYALILTDCQLPEMDGYELARLIRDPSTGVINPRIPIIAVTAHALSGDREKCLACGMDDYLSKPIQTDLLAQILARWTGEVVSSTSAEAAVPRFDASAFVERLMGNEELARRVAAMFVDTMPGQLAALSKAIARSDATASRIAAHSIKGAAANVGGDSVQDLAARMEKLVESGSMETASSVFPELEANFFSLKPLLEEFCRGNV